MRGQRVRFNENGDEVDENFWAQAAADQAAGRNGDGEGDESEGTSLPTLAPCPADFHSFSQLLTGAPYRSTPSSSTTTMTTVLDSMMSLRVTVMEVVQCPTLMLGSKICSH